MSPTMSAINVVVAATGSLPSAASRSESHEQSASPIAKAILKVRGHCFMLLIELDWANFPCKDYFSFALAKFPPALHLRA
jgi:hypothetical protein